MATSKSRYKRAAAMTLAAALTVPNTALVWAQEAPAAAAPTTAPVHHHHRHSVASTSNNAVIYDQQQKIDRLTDELEQMQHQQNDLMVQLKALQEQVAVKAPAAPANAPSPASAPSPATIGQHVAVVESDLAQTKSDLAKNLGVQVHGLVDVGYEHNFNQPNGNANAYHAWDEDGFQLTQGNLHLERDGTVGFVFDLNVGQVANSISSVTHYSNVAPVGGQWIDPTQYYLTYTAPIGSGLSLQAGRFVTLLGEEIIPTYQSQNFNETRGLVFNLGEPLTHTGIRGSYTFNDYVAATAGINNGWDDPGKLNNGGPNYEGELSINNKDKSIALVLNAMWGPNLLGKSDSNLGTIDPIVTVKPGFIPNLTLATEYQYASESGPVAGGHFSPIVGKVIDSHSATWQGVAQYVVYDWGQWEEATRGELFDDEDGSRSGIHQTLWEITQTLTYKVPQVNGLIARLEYRHDQSNQHAFPNNNFVNPVTGAQHLWRGQDVLLGAAIYSF